MSTTSERLTANIEEKKPMKPALKATLALPFVLALLAAFVYLIDCYPIIFAIIAFLGLIVVIWQTLCDLFEY